MHRAAPLLVLALLLPACSSFPSLEPRARWSRWSDAHGGVLEDAQLHERAERALAALRVAALDLDLRIRVLDNGAASAFAWRSGDLFVTRGLLRVLDDTELAAAIAHEIGHLVARADPSADAEDESVADRFGLRILADSGLPLSAMTHMLGALGPHKDAVLASQLRERARLLAAEAPAQAAEIAMTGGEGRGLGR